jgi:hypothetical protein
LNRHRMLLYTQIALASFENGIPQPSECLALLRKKQLGRASTSSCLNAFARRTDGQTKYSGQALPTRSARKDGATIYVELTFAIVRDGTDAVIGALAHARDISERWEREREQRRRLQELEQIHAGA